MSWSKHGYYYRVWRHGGQVENEYVGRGPEAEAAAAEDELRRQQARQRGDDLQEADEAWRGALAIIDRLIGGVDLLFGSELTGAGYHQHARGGWRRRRTNS